MNSKLIFGYEFFDEPAILNARHANLLTSKVIIHSPRENFTNFHGVDDSRFRHSQVVDSIFHYYLLRSDEEIETNISLIPITDASQPYILSTTVLVHPRDWGRPGDSIFEKLSQPILNDLRNKKSMLLLDQSVEGYSIPTLWAWFHEKCKEYSINPECIIYLTGDQSCEVSYTYWFEHSKEQYKLNVIPSTSLSMYVRQFYSKHCSDINFNESLAYKEQNSNDIFLYDCINMRPRPQRIENYLNLLNQDLVKYGNWSMPSPAKWFQMGYIPTPENLKKINVPVDMYTQLDQNIELTTQHTSLPAGSHYWEYIHRILVDMYKHSWVSLVTESSYYTWESSVFISEKTFKPLASMQPFIILGSKHTLKYLQKLGYKTFHPFIDESYDDADDFNRYQSISNELKRIATIEDKRSWYESMRDILEHNRNIFLKILHTKSTEHIAIEQCYFNYFNRK